MAESKAAKREQLVAAAAAVLRAEGVAGCTVRSIAEQSGLSKSAIHYYFEEVDDLVDLAWDRLMGQLVVRMAEAAANAPGPTQALWAAVDVYVRSGAEPHRHRIPMMTFEFLVASRRRGDTAAVAATMNRITSLLRDLVDATGVAEVETVTDILVSSLIGTVVRGEIAPRDTAAALAGIAEVLGLPRPSAQR
jgi:AcrR family transcriptional regulator